MKAIGVIVLAVVAFTSFTGTSCYPINTWFEPNCDGYITLPRNGLSACNKMYQPVCGTDGKTYSNECELCSHKMISKGELKIKHRDACGATDNCYGFPEVCTKEHKPVCGSDGVTYLNKCIFCKARQGKGMANLLELFEGECNLKDYHDGCERYEDMCTYGQVEYRPVCGSDGVTYDNKCDFCHTMRQTKGNLLIVSEGKCTPKDDCYGFPEVCTKEHKPVCGSDGVTYLNKCIFCKARQGKGMANVLVLFEGECKPKDYHDGCERYGDMCTFGHVDYRPVCGSDGVTYNNKCDFCQTKRQTKGNLLIVSEGECKPKDDCYGFTEVCTREHNPVCGSDGVTYSNKCMFCNAKQGKGKANLLILFEGECKPKDNQDHCERYGDMCTMEYRPVCGSDGATYGNKCDFCQTKRQTKGNLLIVSEGECKPKDECEGSWEICPAIYSPVCGSDGVTYHSKCNFCVSKKQHGKTHVQIVSEGECKPKDECEGSWEICPAIHSPVCGSDGVTYHSKCNFCVSKKQHGKTHVQIVSEGECKPKDGCEQFMGNVCPLIHSPVCGSDGVTYSNKCMFCATQKQNTGLRLVSVGECLKQSY